MSLGVKLPLRKFSFLLSSVLEAVHRPAKDTGQALTRRHQRMWLPALLLSEVTLEVGLGGVGSPVLRLGQHYPVSQSHPPSNSCPQICQGEAEEGDH